jgi:hypothetical protein
LKIVFLTERHQNEMLQYFRMQSNLPQGLAAFSSIILIQRLCL